MAEINVCATTKNLETVLRFVDEQLAVAGMDKAARTRAALAAEEIYVNIANYAYYETGNATVRCFQVEEPPGMTLEFIDSGKPFNPLDQKDPDLSMPAEKRNVGGLGVYITRLIAHELAYRREDGRNHLIIRLHMRPPE